MHRRPVFAVSLLACAAIAALTAGCSTPQAAPQPTVSAGPTSSSLSGSADSSGSSTGAPAGTPSSMPSPSLASSTSRQTAITVVAPPGESGSLPPATPGSSTTSRPVVTTTVTVTPTSTSSSPPSTSRTSTSRTTTRTSSTPRTTPTTSPSGTGALAGKVVVIDPGHNGANHLHPEIINKQVPAGFGQYKPCNTTGTETNAGYPEYKFNWNVALAVRDALQAKGITVVMTRDSDDGVGPCVDKRAAIGNDAHADAVVSIHGDGESAGTKGFYVMTASQAPAGKAMATASTDLAETIRNGLAGAGFPTSNALGHDGLWTRSDLAGLNLSLRPTVMIECGNMRNATEADLMSSTSGQQRYAAGIAAGIVDFLRG